MGGSEEDVLVHGWVCANDTEDEKGIEKGELGASAEGGLYIIEKKIG